MLMGQTWAMAQVIATTLFLVVKHYILNQNQGYRLLS
jgi:hypothetical protein